ncbi:MAG: pyruvate dehydrogenase (acetyl-transferring) E1 component subunit alpha [Armatimonadetes bacterium]|nr:pyruvate dehydrogenase (acetyl-transferring) E1 component subunit alpha [Armatimonadota bacterium]
MAITRSGAHTVELLDKLPREEHLEMYRMMVLIRRFEEMAGKKYMEAVIGGFCHLYIGQEAVCVGIQSVLRPDDYAMGTYREHGQALAAGMDARAIMAELFGKATGVSKGKGGSMHLFDKSRNFMGGDAIVGGHLPIAAGVGLSIKYRAADQVCVCYFGDGAVNEGAFHEALNISGLWKLPVIYVCENNLYGMGTQVTRASAVPDLSRRVSGYGIESAHVDGMDLLAVRNLAEVAVRECRNGNGPYFIEAKTYRYRGHSMADPATYRSKDEVEEWRVRDPINLFERQLLDKGLMKDADVQRISSEVDQLVDECVQFAEESPAPSPDALYEYVYASEEI